MRYFITGATGFIGGRIVRKLVAAGHQVAALARDPKGAEALTRLGVSVHEGDITDKESMRAPMTGADRLFHLAGWYKIGSKNPSLGLWFFFVGSLTVLELI